MLIGFVSAMPQQSESFVLKSQVNVRAGLRSFLSSGEVPDREEGKGY